MFGYGAKGVLLSIGTREALGYENWKCFKYRIREPDERVRPVRQQKITRGSCWPDSRVARFSRVMT